MKRFVGKQNQRARHERRPEPQEELSPEPEPENAEPLPENVKLLEDKEEIIIAEKVLDTDSLKIDVNSVTASVTTSYEIIDVKKVIVDMPVATPSPIQQIEEEAKPSTSESSASEESEAESVKAKSASPEPVSITVSSKSSEINEESTMVVLNVETRKSTGELRFTDTPTTVTSEAESTSGKVEQIADEAEQIIVAEKIEDTVTEQIVQSSQSDDKTTE